MSYKDMLEVPASCIKASIVRVMKQEGYIRNFRLISMKGKHFIRIYLKERKNGRNVICGLKRVSRPGRRVYAGVENLPIELDGAGTVIMSTPKGVMSSREAKKIRVGGEVLCTVW